MDEDRTFLTSQGPPAYEERSRRVSPARERSGRSSSQAVRESGGDTTDAQKAEWTGASTTLHRSSYILCLVSVYAALAILSWAVICVLTHKPYNARTYSFSNRVSVDEQVYRKNENIYRAMRVVQALVGLLTIPITSAACSAAAVAYVQHNRHSHGMTMRQTMALADRGWTDPATVVRLFSSFRDFRRMGSLFLLLAIALNIIGGIIQPLQQVLVSTKSVKTSGGNSMTLYHLLDISDQFMYADEPDSQLTVLITRDALVTAKATQPVSQFWHGAGFDCNTVEWDHDTSGVMASACGPGSTLSRHAWLQDPFLAELPNTFTSGVIRQFAPRFNSTARYDSVDISLYPQDCASIDGSYFVRYESSVNDTDDPWFLEVCMPSDQRGSPWTNTKARQDFGEELFVNVSQSSANPQGSIYRLSVNTTGGYFELPNQLNGVLAGPLLDADPWHECDLHCAAQGIKGTGGFDGGRIIWDHSDTEQEDWDYFPDRRKRTTADMNDITLVRNKGPLLTIAMALFGEGSFINTRVKDPSIIVSAAQRLPNNTCIGFAPLHQFLQDTSGFTNWQDSDDPGCLISNATLSREAVDLQVRTWIRIFDNLDNAMLTDAMNAAAFLATKAWMENQVPAIAHSLTVEYDLGMETLIPSISTAGIAVVSIFYLVFLTSLLAMAAYASLTPRWTHSLDAFTMMRLGAAMGSEKLPLLVGSKQDYVRALDTTPGWIADGQADAEVGRLSLGSGTRLRTGRKYTSYGDGRERMQGYRLREMSERDVADGALR